MSRPKKIAITTSSLVETQLERPMHFWRFLVLYSKQLQPSTILGCFSQLLQDVIFISYKDLKRLSNINLLFTR
uniref:Uncharacterized protein n=1 Tax=Physcomitrium patens TaxID=3218 RepID=A0A2K1JP28_PHYPA|nr:hypothetical protein PHYPA_015687 [Physcomitrium patens]